MAGLETTDYLQGTNPAEVVSCPNDPHLAFMIYQAMFAIITPALISGAIERMSFRSYSPFAAVVNVDLLPACPHGMGKGWISVCMVDWRTRFCRWHGRTLSGAALVAAIVTASQELSFNCPHNVPLFC